MSSTQLLEQLRSKGLQLSVLPQVTGLRSSPQLLVMPKSLISPELRQLIAKEKHRLIAAIVTSPKEWEESLPQLFWPFASLIECARRGSISKEPIVAANLPISDPGDWVLDAVDRISCILEQKDLAEIQQYKINRVLAILRAIESWAADAIW